MADRAPRTENFPMLKSLAVAAVAIAALAQPHHAAAQTEKVIRIGIMAGPYADIVHFASKIAEKEGIKVKVVEFSEYKVPNEALATDELDLNNFQHQPYLDNQVKQHKYDIVSIAKSIIVPFGIYSKKFADVASIPSGSSAALPNDPSNTARALELYEKAGLIKLRPGKGINATLSDVVENPKNLKFIELDAAQIPRSLDDLGVAAINLNYVLFAGIDPKKALIREGADTNWNLIFATREKNKSNPTINRFVEIYRSNEVKEFIAKRFEGTILTTW